ncbi:MAG: transketolase [Magnetococcales bacterium]|nr:transketolase [Magnetococcales bacterium]MBF0322710.1 transketolase [Magnetococcales bacterium]
MRRACHNMIHELVRRDSRVIFLGSDLGPGTLDGLKKEFPSRFFMEGVAEQNLIGVAAGLALEGFIPYVNTIATFLTRRCLEQITLDLCLQNLPVRLIGNGGGLVYAPQGPTHMAVDDLGLMRLQPNMTVVSPADADEMRRFMEQTLAWPGPIYVRLGKGGDPVVSRAEDPFVIGQAIPLRQGNDATLIATGVVVNRALKAAELLEEEEGVSCGVLNMHTLKPLDTAAILALAKHSPLLVTLEEHSRIGGLGSAVADTLMDAFPSPLPRLVRLGLPDAFPEGYGSQDALMDRYGLQPLHIVNAVLDHLPTRR